MRKYRPIGKSRYWTISDTETEVAFQKELYPVLEKLGKRTRDDGLDLNFREGFEQPDFGALRRSGVKLVGLSGVRRAASFYPASTLMSQDKWSASLDERTAAYAALDSVNIINVDGAGGQTRGFAYCYSEEWPRENTIANAKGAPATTTVDGMPVASAPEHWRGNPGQVGRIFERDEYMYVDHLFYLESTGGDV